MSHIYKTKVKLSPSIKKLKGAIKLPAEFDYKKELSNSVLMRYTLSRSINKLLINKKA